jgi:DinB family protein
MIHAEDEEQHMDEQQLTLPEEIQWYERQQQLSHCLASEEPAQLATALELFLEQHAQLHSSNGLAHSALAGLSDEQWRLKPGPGTNSVAWLALHMARIEDVTFNLLVMERAQVFDSWFEHLGFDRRDVGTGMSDEEVLELSTTIHLKALRAYWSAVGQTTQDLARALHPATLKERPDKRNIQRLFDEGAVTPQLAELALRWEQQTKGMLLFQPISRHTFWHLNEIRQVRERFSVS